MVESALDVTAESSRTAPSFGTVNDGPPVVLNTAEAPTYADTNAVVAWSANLQTQLKTSFKAGALIGRGSGEALQVAFHGTGFVIVQPSEGFPVTAAP